MSRTVGKTRQQSALLLCLAISFSTCRAQSFQWGFINNTLAVSSSPVLTQCLTYTLQIINTTNGANAFGVPPYYITAFKSSGIPTTSLLGSDPTNLTWTVNQASGSSLLLSVMDSAGNAGGIDPPTYTVADGSSGCLPSSPSVDFKLSANVSSSVQTCEPMGFQISGNGQKPYNVSIVIANFPVVSNVTLGANDDQFTYTNHADSNGHLIVAVSDANGVWGTSSELFTSVASTDFSCVNTVSSSDGTSTSSVALPTVTQTSPNPSSTSSSNRTAIIVAVVVSVCATGLLVLFALCFRWWRARRAFRSEKPEPAVVPDAWYSPVPVIDSSAFPGTTNGSNSSLYDPVVPSSAGSKLARLRALNGSSSVDTSATYLGAGLGQGPRPGSSVYDNSSSSMVGRVGYSASTPSASAFPSGSESKSQTRRPPGVPADLTVESSIVIQHEDAGAVQEIPPPYRAPDSGAGPSNSNYVHTGSG